MPIGNTTSTGDAGRFIFTVYPDLFFQFTVNMQSPSGWQRLARGQPWIRIGTFTRRGPPQGRAGTPPSPPLPSPHAADPSEESGRPPGPWMSKGRV